jgi:tetratricopeptide (TPR) repeat protein
VQADEIVRAEDTTPSLDLEPASEASAALDEKDPPSTQSIGTLIGVGAVGRSFAEVFAAFKRGIEEQVGAGDADTHFDLAIAYKEMGLHEDAVRELEAVLRTGTRTSEALSLLAHCKLFLGDPAAAVAHLEDALARAADSDQADVSLRYDLGEALLAAGREAEALEAFTKVAALDPKFRDVAARVARFG